MTKIERFINVGKSLFAMGKDQTMSLEERLIGEARTTLQEIKSAIDLLSSNGGEYRSLMGGVFETYTGWMDAISRGAQTVEGHLQELSVIYKDRNAASAKSNMFDAAQDYFKSIVAKLRSALKKKSDESASAESSHAAEATERALERKLVHDINNGLGSVMGFSELLLMDGKYGGLLGEKYGAFKGNLELINSGTKKLVAKLRELSGVYSTQEQKIKPVPASTLDSKVKAITYFIVHIDDQKESMDAVYNALSFSSNIIPPEAGVFGHEGRRVNYIVASYSSVKEALEILDAGKKDQAVIDLLITDREMPEQDGYSLLNALNSPKNSKQRKPEYANVKNIAMLTGGITKQDAKRTGKTYGIPVFTKPIQPLQLEQQVYNAINQKK